MGRTFDEPRADWTTVGERRAIADGGIPVSDLTRLLATVAGSVARAAAQPALARSLARWISSSITPRSSGSR
jgi:hypothetical protein